MATVRCPNRHYYDDSKYSVCPHCGVTLSGIKFPETRWQQKPEVTGTVQEEEKTEARTSSEDGDVTVCRSSVPQDGRTIGIFRKKFNGNPVVGWLVCSVGEDRGCDYRLYPGNNQIGRSEAMDIPILWDLAIAREKHFSVVHDPKSNLFHIIPGEGTVTKLNGLVLQKAELLEAYDVITAGETELTFVPFCKGDVHW